MTGQHFIDRKPQAEQCPRCHRLQLLGIDEGLPYRVDVLPLTVYAEIEAIKQGRRTYAINGDYVTHRDAMRIKGDAKRGRPAVLAKHACFEAVRPEYIEVSAVAEVRRLLRIKSTNPIPVVEADALFHCSEGLGGVIIDQAPF